MQRWLREVQSVVLGGQNASRDPDILPEDQFARGRNVSVRGGRLRPRPVILKRTTLDTGIFQGATYFSKHGGSLVASIGGKIFQIDVSDFSDVELLPGDRNAPHDTQAWFCETPSTLLIQNNRAYPISYNGAEVRRLEDPEVPIGSAMAFSNGRLAVVMGDGTLVRVGDIYKPDKIGSELQFTEWTALLGGGTFGFPSKVVALASIPVINTATGHGSLVVACRDRTYTLRTEITDRETWYSTAGFQTILFPFTGFTGPVSFANVNQDIFFRAVDGLRSLRLTVADYNDAGSVPVSREVRNVLDHDTDYLLPFTSIVYFDNRVLMTHSPSYELYDGRGIAGGMIALNFDPLSERGQQFRSAFEGEWDGIKISQLVVGKFNDRDRCFAFAIDEAGDNVLVEILAEGSEESLEGEDPIPCVSSVETRAFSGGDPKLLKQLVRADLHLSDIRGSVDVKVQFRPDNYPFWVDWDEWTVCAQMSQELTGFSIKPEMAMPQFRSKLVTKSIPDKGMTEWMNGRPFCVGHTFQIRVEWTGQARIEHLQVHMEPKLEAPYAEEPASTCLRLEQPA